MLAKLKIHSRISPTSLEKTTPQGSVSGRLFVEIDGLYFPDYDWFDYVLPVLGWWLEDATRLLSPGLEVKSRFMDGPYELGLVRTAGSADVLLTLCKNGRPGPNQYKVSYARYLATLRGAAKSVLNDLAEIGLNSSPEASTLETRLEHLERLESHIKDHGLP
jgi:hypothetical protein